MEPNITEEKSAEQQRNPARGLDQVSHLFLSQVAERAIRGRSQKEPERPVHVPPESQPVVLYASCSLVREQLLSLLSGQPQVLEEGMRVIDSDLPCETPGNIELLALDSINRLTVIDVDDKVNDGLLLRGMAHLDWVVVNTPLLQRMYREQVINFSIQPRLFLVAPDFSPLFRYAIRQIKSLEIHCLKYHAVGLPGGTGILCEELFSEHS